MTSGISRSGALSRRLRRLARRAAVALAVAAVAALLVAADRAGLFGTAREADWPKYHAQRFKVVRVVDGDTLDIDCPDGSSTRTRIRLLGADAPETVRPNTPVQHFGPEAGSYVGRHAQGRTVTLQLDPIRTRDTLGRLLAYVVLPDGSCLNLSLVASGHAYADPRFPHPRLSEFRKAQKQAMSARLGLWREVRQADLPPYYRDKLRLPDRPAATQPG